MRVSAESFLDAALSGTLTEADARRLYGLGPEAVTLVLLATARRVAELEAAGWHASTPDPATPSGQVPVYTKPTANKRRKRPGAKPGHPGTRRPRPAKIDDHEDHRLPRCPQCDGKLQRSSRTRTRIIEDIPETITPVVTEHTIHRDYCPRCKRHVEPVVPDALPKCTLGHHLIGLTAWFHYGLGITINSIISILAYHLQTKLTSGGLVAAWMRVATILEPWYDQIGEQAKSAAVLHADETGWRIEGQTCWLWCFATAQTCYYMIDGSRGSPALQSFFTDTFDGTLVTDFWAAYESVCAADRQKCLPHLLREIERVDQRNDTPAWQAFARKLRRLLHDALRLRARPDFTPKRYAGRIARLERRLAALADGRSVDADATRLARRLARHRDHLFTFLHKPDVPADNNHGERQIRPAVIIRKNSQSNRSDDGAATQAILMSIYRTLRLRGLDPNKTLAAALRTDLTSGHLPPLPDATTADG
ncbi:MAG: IS66 family transposase [Planctomycetota bacterium]